jgi:hypothetical protein
MVKAPSRLSGELAEGTNAVAAPGASSFYRPFYVWLHAFAHGGFTAPFAAATFRTQFLNVPRF